MRYRRLFLMGLLTDPTLGAFAVLQSPVPWLGVNLRRSPDRWCILDAAIRPQTVEPTRNTKPGANTDVPFENFSVVSHMLDDTLRPILRESNLLSKISVGTNQ